MSKTKTPKPLGPLTETETQTADRVAALRAELESLLPKTERTTKPKGPRKARLSKPQQAALDSLTAGATLTWVFPGPCKLGDAKVDPMVVRALEARRLLAQAPDGTWALVPVAASAAA